MRRLSTVVLVLVVSGALAYLIREERGDATAAVALGDASTAIAARPSAAEAIARAPLPVLTPEAEALTRVRALDGWVTEAERLARAPSRMCDGCQLLLAPSELAVLRDKCVAATSERTPGDSLVASMRPGGRLYESLTLRERTFLEDAGFFDMATPFGSLQHDALVARPEDHAERFARDPDLAEHADGGEVELIPYGEH